MEEARKKTIKEAFIEIIKFGVCFRGLTLYLIRKKHPKINLSRINFASLKGHDLLDPNDGVVVGVKMEFQENTDQVQNFTVLEDSGAASVEIDSESPTLN